MHNPNIWKDHDFRSATSYISLTSQSFSDRFGRSDAPLIKRRNAPKGEIMLWTIFVILLILWLLGLVSSYTLGGFIHILLVIALVVLVIELVGRRRVL